MINNRHKTKDGRLILIESMDDKHLFNYIKGGIRQLNELKTYMAPRSGITAIYQDSVVSIEQAKQTFFRVSQNLSFYIAEATLRGIYLPQITELLQELFERDGAVQLPEPRGVVLRISSGPGERYVDVEDDYDDEIDNEE